MNTFSTLYDHAVLGAHRPRNLLAPCPTNIRTVGRLQAAMQRIDASRRQRCAYRGLPRLVSFEVARERLIATARAS